jgi:endonuclease/exonuclease/phosphatase family metal-dependent hydrolase
MKSALVCTCAFASIAISGCKAAPPPQPPPVTAQGPEPEPEPEPEPKPPPKVPEDAIAVGTFNVEWAFDDIDKRPKQARPHQAQTAEDWNWKRDSIAKILIAEELDVVTLTEIGGEREAMEVADAVLAGGGYRYDVACLPTRDKATGKHVAVLSRFSMTDVRRLATSIDKQLAVDIELPSGDTVVLVALHLQESQQPAYASKRRKAARGLRRELSRTVGERPLLVMGTFGSQSHPYDDDYARRTPGILSGRDNKEAQDDCTDSAADTGRTTTAGTPSDHIIWCGLELRRATTSSESDVVRELEDPADSPWPSIPIEQDPYRDVSDHYLVWAEIAMPKPEAPAKPDDTAL